MNCDGHMECSSTVIEAGVLTEAQGIAQPVPWWSFTKTILAAAAPALVRDGRLTLGRLVPNRPFTLRQLLQHRAGLAITKQSLVETSRSGNYWSAPTPNAYAMSPGKGGAIRILDI